MAFPVEGFTPLFKTGTPEQATWILRTCRDWTDSMVAPLDSAQRVEPTVLGDGTWSVKDLLGHLTAWEERALVVLGVRARPSDEPAFSGADDFNAWQLARRRAWPLERVERDYDDVRSALVAAVEAVDEERWRAKVDTPRGRSALGLVLGRLLTGGTAGHFAHDFAHRVDLAKAVRLLRP